MLTYKGFIRKAGSSQNLNKVASSFEVNSIKMDQELIAYEWPRVGVYSERCIAIDVIQISSHLRFYHLNLLTQQPTLG